MAIATANNKKPIRPDASIQKVIDTQVVVDIDTAIEKTRQYIDGSKWTIDYYRQILTAEDSTSNIDSVLPDVEQQYERVKQLVLTVTTPIDTNSLDKLEGEAVIDKIKPSVNDIIRTTLIDNREVLLRVTEVNDVSYNLKRLYNISFKIDAIYTLDPVKFKTLDSRVVKDYTYNLDSIYTMSDGILLDSNQAYYDYLYTEIPNVIDEYINRFKSKRSLLLLDYDGIRYYDTVVTYLFRSLLTEYKEIRYVEDDLVKGTVVDYLLKGDLKRLHNSRQIGYGPTHKAMTDYNYRYRDILGGYVHKITVESGETLRVNNELLPKHLESDKSYLFTVDFYNNKSNLSLIESSLLKMIKGELINHDDIKKLLVSTIDFTDIESYLYTPFIILLAKYSMTKIFNK